MYLSLLCLFHMHSLEFSCSEFAGPLCNFIFYGSALPHLFGFGMLNVLGSGFPTSQGGKYWARPVSYVA